MEGYVNAGEQTEQPLCLYEKGVSLYFDIFFDAPFFGKLMR